jgi:hypothetical protein
VGGAYWICGPPLPARGGGDPARRRPKGPTVEATSLPRIDARFSDRLRGFRRPVGTPWTTIFPVAAPTSPSGPRFMLCGGGVFRIFAGRLGSRSLEANGSLVGIDDFLRGALARLPAGKKAFVSHNWFFRTFWAKKPWILRRGGPSDRGKMPVVFRWGLRELDSFVSMIFHSAETAFPYWEMSQPHGGTVRGSRRAGAKGGKFGNYRRFSGWGETVCRGDPSRAVVAVCLRGPTIFVFLLDKAISVGGPGGSGTKPLNL